MIHTDPFNQATDIEQEAIGLARGLGDGLADALRLAMRTHVADASPHDLRVLGARAFVLARRLEVNANTTRRVPR